MTPITRGLEGMQVDQYPPFFKEACELLHSSSIAHFKNIIDQVSLQPPAVLVEVVAHMFQLKIQRQNIDSRIEQFLIERFSEKTEKDVSFIGIFQLSLEKYLKGDESYAPICKMMLEHSKNWSGQHVEWILSQLLTSDKTMLFLAPLVRSRGEPILAKVLENMVAQVPVDLKIAHECVRAYVDNHGMLPIGLLNLAVDQGIACTKDPQWFGSLFLGYEVVKLYDCGAQRKLIKRVLEHLSCPSSQENIDQCLTSVLRGRPSEFFDKLKKRPVAVDPSVMILRSSDAPSVHASEVSRVGECILLGQFLAALQMTRVFALSSDECAMLLEIALEQDVSAPEAQELINALMEKQEEKSAPVSFETLLAGVEKTWSQVLSQISMDLGRLKNPGFNEMNQQLEELDQKFFERYQQDFQKKGWHGESSLQRLAWQDRDVLNFLSQKGATNAVIHAIKDRKKGVELGCLLFQGATTTLPSYLLMTRPHFYLSFPWVRETAITSNVDLAPQEPDDLKKRFCDEALALRAFTQFVTETAENRLARWFDTIPIDQVHTLSIDQLERGIRNMVTQRVSQLTTLLGGPQTVKALTQEVENALTYLTEDKILSCGGYADVLNFAVVSKVLDEKHLLAVFMLPFEVPLFDSFYRKLRENPQATFLFKIRLEQCLFLLWQKQDALNLKLHSCTFEANFRD